MVAIGRIWTLSMKSYWYVSQEQTLTPKPVWYWPIFYNLKPFLLLTKQFEENSPNGSIVLPEYSIMLDSLKNRRASLDEDDPLYPMIAEMVIWLEKYWNEALQCESLVFATILNPLFRHRFFEKTFGPQDPKAVDSLKAFTSKFDIRKTEHSDLDSQQ